MSTLDVKIPDIGDFKNIPIIELHVKPGDVIKAEDPILTLESDKATMEVPSPHGGKVVEVLVKAGDKVSEGVAVVRIEATGANGAVAKPAPAAASAAPAAAEPPKAPTPAAAPEHAPHSAVPPPIPLDFGGVYASPSVRRLARELDIDLTKLSGTGEKGRITIGDVKTALKGPGGTGSGAGIPEVPAQDYAKFGPIETKPLSRLKKLSGPHLHRAWLNVPLVTHTDEADITEIEAYRKMLDSAAKEKGYRVTLLAFLIKAAVSSLKAHPEFNASLSADKQSLIYKKYYNIGVAVDTPDGLVVPVVKDADRKGIIEISQELGAVSKKMRDGKITPADISGGTFSISSLGGIGGINFTPLVSAPEVAIMGVPRASMKPVWDGHEFKPRLVLPLCLSYDHRIIDGAQGARFARHFASVMEDVRQLVL